MRAAVPARATVAVVLAVEVTLLAVVPLALFAILAALAAAIPDRFRARGPVIAHSSYERPHDPENRAHHG
jgi:hypothetical protein